MAWQPSGKFLPLMRSKTSIWRGCLWQIFLLDSLPYNAHTTGSDALWAGLPLLTCRGNAFSGRVGASLLQAIGLAELVTECMEDYES